MGELRQSPEQRARLEAAWQANPVVEEMREQAEAFAHKNGLRFASAEDQSRLAAFISEWIEQNNIKLPDSGILIG